VTFTWEAVTAQVAITRNYRVEGWTLLDIRVTSPPGAPLPFAVDGSRHHGLEQAELDAAGGVLAFLTAWAEREAGSPAYATALANWKQGDLFGGL
jgi:hypothetical protein